MGTLVRISLRDLEDAAMAQAAFDSAFVRIAHIGQVMCAHRDDSDLARLARAQPGERLALDPDTVTVLLQARRFWADSGARFDPARAGIALAARGLRPGLRPVGANLAALEVLDASQVRVAAPVSLDLGGIAKGYAVDQAVLALQRSGVRSGLVNAGGDLRAFGPHAWPVRICHDALGAAPSGPSGRGRAPFKLLQPWCRDLLLREAALASSVSRPLTLDFVGTGVRRARGRIWRGCSVLAPDAMTADALTKWGLQSGQAAPALQRVLRNRRACMWTSP